jgi:hypothetical protein
MQVPKTNNPDIGTYAKYAGKSILHVVGTSLDTITSIPLIACNILTAGAIPQLSILTSRVALSAKYVLPDTLMFALKKINPNAHIWKYPIYPNQHKSELKNFIENRLIGENDGLFPNITTRYLRQIAREVRDYSRNIFHEQITSRALYALGLLISPIARSADTAIAIVAVPASLVTVGQYASINGLAYLTLQGPNGLLWDINYFGTHMLNPYTKTAPKKPYRN